MNCTHTGAFCAHAQFCDLQGDEHKADACGNYLEDPKSNRIGCDSCLRYGTAGCRWACFRETAAHSYREGYVHAKEHNEGERVRAYIAAEKRRKYEAWYASLTPYQRMKHDGELAAQRAATAAKRIAEAQNVVDTTSPESVSCAAQGDEGGQA